MQLESIIGFVAAAATSLSYLPQVKKAWPRKSTADLSWRTLALLTAGLLLWILYGHLRGDRTVMLANMVGVTLSGLVLAFKLRDMRERRNHRS